MATRKLEMKWSGVAPLIMHSGQLSDPLSKWSKEMKRVSSKRSKTDADHEQMAKIEFFGSLYMGADGPVIPAENIEAVLIEGAKKVRRGVDAKAGLYVLEHAKLEYDGPRDPEQIWSDEQFRSRVPVRIQKNRIMRTRPIFKSWSLLVRVEFEDSLLNQADVLEFSKKAGAIVGLCDWRPKYGRFAVL